MFSSDPSARERTIRSVPGVMLLAVALPMPDVARTGVGRVGIVPLATGLARLVRAVPSDRFPDARRIDMRHALVTALALALGACAANPEEPRVTVYHALARSEIRAHMRELADELGTLFELTRTAAPVDEARRADVLASLGRIDERARRVGGGGAVTNHSAVNDYMDGFLGDVALARDFADREPVNLVPANRLVQSCLACHQSL